jgi:hypothetical protein
VLQVHINGIRGISIHITEFKIHISYSENLDSTRMLSSIIFTCHAFQPSPISLLRVGNTFSISSPFDITKFQKIVCRPHRLAAFHSQCQWTRIFVSLTTPIAMEIQLRFKRHRQSHYSSQCSRKRWIRHLSMIIFTGLPFSPPNLWGLEVHINAIRVITIYITESKIKKS